MSKNVVVCLFLFLLGNHTVDFAFLHFLSLTQMKDIFFSNPSIT